MIPPLGHYHPQSHANASFPSPLISYFFLFWDEAVPFLALLSLPMNCPVCLLPLICLISPHPHDFHNFPPPLESATDSWSHSPEPSESDTNSVATPFPSESAYDVEFETKVPWVVALPVNLGRRPHLNDGTKQTACHPGWGGQGISPLVSCWSKLHIVILFSNILTDSIWPLLCAVSLFNLA